MVERGSVANKDEEGSSQGGLHGALVRRRRCFRAMHDEERYADELAAVKAHPTALGLDRRGRLPKIMPADDDRQDLSGTAHYQRALRFSSVLGSYDLAGRSA